MSKKILVDKPGLFGLVHSNRNFTHKDSWGKNCFNSSFPASLCCYLFSRSFQNIFLKLDRDLKIICDQISTSDLYGLDPLSENLFYAFESPFTPYQQYVIGNFPRVDLVTQARDTGICLQPIEIKLTALPDHTTCDLSEDLYGCEIVVRPDTIVYLACSIVDILRTDIKKYNQLIIDIPDRLDWTEANMIIPYIPQIIDSLDKIMLSIIDQQRPLLMQPIWKTEGKSPKLAEYCLDIFVWSNLAFTRLFIDLTKSELENYGMIKSITRNTRTAIWLFKMLSDFNKQGFFDHSSIIDSLSYNTKNDKAFAVSGKITHSYMSSEFLSKPRIKKTEIQNIILGGGQYLLSPERRFDAIVYNSPDLFS